MKFWVRARACLFLFGVLAGAGCGRSNLGNDGGTDRTTPVPPAAEDSQGGVARQRILCLGTSLTAGPGLDPAETWPALLQARVDSLGLPFEFVNAGVSGETSAGALRRADWLFSQGPIAILVVETGANDGLRGQPTDSLEANIDALLTRAERLVPAPHLVVAAMEALPNFGAAYGKRFRELYPRVAKAHNATLLPFLLNTVAGVDSLNQGDGLHPTAAGERIVAENVWRVLAPLLQTGR